MELRSVSTNILGERFYIYASKGRSSLVTGHLSGKKKAWSKDLTNEQPPDWMIELAEQVGMIEPGALLPTGVIVGSATIEKVTPLPLTTNNQQLTTLFQWHLADVERAKKLRKAKNHPQLVWFNPF